MKCHISRKDWSDFIKEFKKTEYYDNHKENGWECPINKLNPKLLEKLINLNQRLEELEDKK